MAGVFGGQNDKFNTEVNVVPFIDLLSCLISFLLITAVWVQIAAIPASIDSKGKVSTAPPPPEHRLEIRLTSKSVQLKWPAALTAAGNYPGALDNVKNDFDLPALEKILKVAANQKLIATASVSADDDVDYGAVARTIDSVKSGGISSVALNIN
jgi:biopolymer transport protein TolR